MWNEIEKSLPFDVFCMCVSRFYFFHSILPSIYAALRSSKRDNARLVNYSVYIYMYIRCIYIITPSSSVSFPIIQG